MNKELSKNDYHLIMDSLMRSKMVSETNKNDNGFFERVFVSNLRTYAFSNSVKYQLELSVHLEKDKTEDGFSYEVEVLYLLCTNEVFDGLSDAIKKALDESKDDDEYLSLPSGIVDELKGNIHKSFELKMKVYSFDEFQKAIKIKKEVISLVDRMF